MKKILIIAVLIFAFMFVMVQNSDNHFTFEGIPITGTLENFAQKLVAKGFKKIDSDKTYVELEGKFAGYSGCKIYVFKVPNRNIVYGVGVVFPKKSSWANLEEEYNKFKGMLTNKCGKPASHYETFKEGASTFNDEAKMRSLKEGNCDYWTRWEVENGYIRVKIFSLPDTDDGNISLIYYDKINSDLAQKATEDDL